MEFYEFSQKCKSCKFWWPSITGIKGICRFNNRNIPCFMHQFCKHYEENSKK